MNTQINRRNWLKKLLVEGKEDLHVVANVRNSCQLADNFDIVDCESVSNVNLKLASLLKTKLEVIGIVIDADADTESPEQALTARWQSIRDLLRREGYTVSDDPAPDGTIIAGFGRKPKIGIWLMPDNVQYPGMLEDFVSTMIPPGDLTLSIAKQALTEVDNARAKGQGSLFKPVHRSKALIHTWLSWQDEPGKPMGIAIRARMLDHNTHLCQRFTAWLNTLFS
ncbi:hypothetical protein CLV58_11497 [Spirosoma oryzae]|uniref:Uncharacterized protein n=1 Tax=Spirosoma oryzae TaxID=1469603 RepID=A0A2T0SQ13_9BACT|nr:DUF3226 domain-containing protein [Spirosoma oryzae]PRY35512.1 hypothetical protein CLV58_11497 [Spirosoma oryzae]